MNKLHVETLNDNRKRYINMRKIYANIDIDDEPTTLEEVPDIDGKFYNVDVILDWLDTLEEVHENESDSSDK
jgi:hypothetical protein